MVAATDGKVAAAAALRGAARFARSHADRSPVAAGNAGHVGARVGDGVGEGVGSEVVGTGVGLGVGLGVGPARQGSVPV